MKFKNLNYKGLNSEHTYEDWILLSDRLISATFICSRPSSIKYGIKINSNLIKIIYWLLNVEVQKEYTTMGEIEHL